jgi:hypothetical protein
VKHDETCSSTAAEMNPFSSVGAVWTNIDHRMTQLSTLCHASKNMYILYLYPRSLCLLHDGLCMLVEFLRHLNK